MRLSGAARIPGPHIKKQWAPTPSAFGQLLVWLGGDAAAGGDAYVEMRRRLVEYFERRRCTSADDLADETLNRVARRLSEEPAIVGTPAGRYCYITAKFVFLEHLRSTRRTVEMDALTDGHELAHGRDPGDPVRDRMLDCLEQCLEALPARDRELILDYYRGDRQVRIANRRSLAGRLGLSSNAISIRACRIRDTLESCVRSCAER
jgi:DNA-directed RNA polymerase specialized sigma24 family protein